MKIAVIDADFIANGRHRFPNLTCMKLSGFWKSKNADVSLKTDYKNLDNFDRVFIAKVFTKTKVPEFVFDLKNVEYGGTGFFLDQAVPLPDEIEHCMPDYHLYDDVADGKYYRDYSIGFLTRGCFRHCSFCVNRKSSASKIHSPLNEFLDPSRKKICLLDDNFLACPDWKKLLLELQSTGKRFQFRQGLDVRLLDDEKIDLLFNSNHEKLFHFAFDDVNETPIIEKQLDRIRRKFPSKQMLFYVLTGLDRSGKYDLNFWRQDLFNLIKRIEILAKYHCETYVMRFEKIKLSPFRKIVSAIAKWCNLPYYFYATSPRDFSTLRIGKSLRDFENLFPEVSYFFDFKPSH